MILTHTGAYDYARRVLDFAGAGGVTRSELRQKVRGESAGSLMFKSNVERPDGCGWDMQECSVPYRLPIEPERLKRQILRNYSPSASKYLRG